MADAAIVLMSALGVGAGHALLLRRLAARLGRRAGSAGRVALGALALRLLPAGALLAATRWGDAPAALVALAGLWIGRTTVLIASGRRI